MNYISATDEIKRLKSRIERDLLRFGTPEALWILKHL